MKKIYTGQLVYTTKGEEDKLLGLMNNWKVEEPFAEGIQNDMRFGHFLSVRYIVSDTPIMDPTDAIIRSGLGEVEYGAHYSEITGYLWTDEEIKVGGHDLLNELKSYLGKFLWIEIAYSK